MRNLIHSDGRYTVLWTEERTEHVSSFDFASPEPDYGQTRSDCGAATGVIYDEQPAGGGTGAERG